MSAFSRLRGLPSAVHSTEPASPALREFEAALCQRKDPSARAVTGDMSALSLLSTLRTASKSLDAAEASSRNSLADDSGPLDLMAEESERRSCISPWSSKSSERDTSEVLFVNEGREVDVDEGGAPLFNPLEAAPSSDPAFAEPESEGTREASATVGAPPRKATAQGGGMGAGAAASAAPAEEAEELTVPFRISSRPSSARTAELLNGVHAQHAQQLHALLSAFGGASDGSGAAGATIAGAQTGEGTTAGGAGAADGPEDGGLDGRLDGVLEALQRCRASLSSQQSSAVGDEEEAEAEVEAEAGGGAHGDGGLVEADSAELAGAGVLVQAGGSGARGPEEGGEEEGGEERGTVALLLECFPPHIGELFAAESAELKEMALNRLQARPRARERREPEGACN